MVTKYEVATKNNKLYFYDLFQAMKKVGVFEMLGFDVVVSMITTTLYDKKTIVVYKTIK